MKTRQLATIVFITAILLLVSSTAQPTAAQTQPIPFASPTSVSDPARVSAALRSSPVMFIENVGQFGVSARFQVRGGNGTVYLADDALWFTILEKPKADAAPSQASPTPKRTNEPTQDTPRKGVNLKLSFVGANPNPRLEPFNRLDTHVSYFIGNDSKKWRADVPVWGGVRYKDLYPGIDLEITSEKAQLVQRVVARTGANLNALQLRVDGVEKMTLESDRLRLATAVGEYTMPLLQVSDVANTILPRSTIAGNQIKSPFTKSVSGNQQFLTRAVDSSDLLYSTYLGGTDPDRGDSIAVDVRGAAYITGNTASSDFPATPGAFNTINNMDWDAFVTKLNPDGSALVYSTFLGGTQSDSGSGIAVDANGTAYITGFTSSSDFPTTQGAFDNTYNGCFTSGNCSYDAFVTKLNANGSALVYSTFLGGSDYEYSRGIAVDGSGAAYITGETLSSEFPTTPGAFSRTPAGGFVTKLNAEGSALVYSTFFNAGQGIAVDGSGATFITGETTSPNFPTTPGAFDITFNGGQFGDAFVTKFNAQGSALVYSTFLGGSDTDVGFGIAVDASGAAYITGETSSSDFPVTPGVFDSIHDRYSDAFVTKLNADGSALVYSTYLGGYNDDISRSIAVDRSGAAYITGNTSSPNFPTTPGAFDTSLGDVFVTKLNPDGSALVYSTFFGGTYSDGSTGIAVDESGAAYITGETLSSDFPTTPGAFDNTFGGYNCPGFSGYCYDVFVSKMAMGSVPR